MTQYYIYKIICLCDDWNGKFYIGKHYGKLDDNYTGSGRLINDYFKKYGKVLDKTYVKEIIDYGDENNICDLEMKYIEEGMQSELCLNIKCVSSKGHFGQKHSEESRNKMSEAKKGKQLSNEHKRKLSEASKGKPKSEEHRKHMSEAHKGHFGQKHSEETRNKIGEAHKGMKHSEESRKKMSEAAKRRWARN